MTMIAVATAPMITPSFFVFSGPTSASAAVRRANAWNASVLPLGSMFGSDMPPTLAHVRIRVIGRRHEGLLDGPRRGPAQQVEDAAGLVVRARGARPAERLLADDRAGRLVVDVEVAGPEAKRVRRPLDDPAVGGEDRARQ